MYTYTFYYMLFNGLNVMKVKRRGGALRGYRDARLHPAD